MIDKEEDLSAKDDSSSYVGSVVIGLVLIGFYFASRAWLSEGAFFRIASTIALLYLVTGPFRTHWREPRFWAAVVLLFVGHTALLWYLAPRLRAWSFWGYFTLVAPESLAMILALGWIVGDNYFTRNTRRQRARATAQQNKDQNTGVNRRGQRTDGLDQRSSSEKNS